MREITVQEQYAPRKLFLEIGGFTSSDFTAFLKENGIEKDDDTDGFPVFKIMTALNAARKRGRFGKDTDTDEELKREKINQIRIANNIKMKSFIPRSEVIERWRTTLQALANKIRYSVKTAAPRLVNMMNVRDIENILIGYYNQAIEDLFTRAKIISRWEDYGTTNNVSGGSELVESPIEDTSWESSGEAEV